MRTAWLFFCMGAACLSMAQGDQNRENSSSRTTVEGVKPGVSDDSSPRQTSERQNGRYEIAQGNPTDPGNIERGHFRMGNWDNHENWRYNREQFYRGETQAQAYRENHPYGPGGVGYDGDENYYRNLRRYEQLHGQNQQNYGDSQFQYDMQQYRHYQQERGQPESDYGQGSPNRGYQQGYYQGYYQGR